MTSLNISGLVSWEIPDRKLRELRFMKKIRFFIVNANDWYNKGDVTNRLGLILALQRVFKNRDIQIYLESLTPYRDKDYFGRFRNIKVIRSLFASETRKRASIVIKHTAKGIILFFALFFLALLFPLLRKIPENSEEYHNFLNNVRLNVALLFSSDVIISSPGGFLHDDYPPILLINLLPLVLAILLRKPLVIYNQSIGPFKSNIWARFTKAVVRRASIITVREEISLRFLRDNRVILATDATFSIKSYIKKYLRSGAKKERINKFLTKLSRLRVGHYIIGITLVGYYVLHKGVHYFLKYIDFLGSCLSELNRKGKSENLRFYYVVLPQNTNDYEILLIKLIVTILRKKYKLENILLIDKDLEPEELFAILNEVNLLIASRMHSAIFASILAKPIIMLAYQPKFHGIAKMLNLKDLVFDIFRLNRKSVQKFVDKVMWIIKHSTQISEMLNQKTDALEKRSLIPALMIKKLIQERE